VIDAEERGHVAHFLRDDQFAFTVWPSTFLLCSLAEYWSIDMQKV
jgi:hypothetical protein